MPRLLQWVKTALIGREPPSAKLVPWTDRRAIVNHRSSDQDKPSSRMRLRHEDATASSQSSLSAANQTELIDSLLTTALWIAGSWFVGERAYRDDVVHEHGFLSRRDRSVNWKGGRLLVVWPLHRCFGNSLFLFCSNQSLDYPCFRPRNLVKSGYGQLSIQNCERCAKEGILAVPEHPAAIVMFRAFDVDHGRMCAFNVSKLVRREPETTQLLGSK
ncbi:hypothetical protein P3T22_002838 [Paraburkholderia sp. GAS348]